jgi:hypothetical protein
VPRPGCSLAGRSEPLPSALAPQLLVAMMLIAIALAGVRSATRAPYAAKKQAAGATFEPVGFLYPDSGQAAARWYLWMSPPSRCGVRSGRLRVVAAGRVLAGCVRGGPLVVVVLEVLAEDAVEVALVADQEPVEALCADGADEALGIGVRDGCADRRLDDPGPFAREHGVERGSELAVAITDQEPERGECRFQGSVARACWQPMCRSGVGRLRRGGRVACRSR